MAARNITSANSTFMLTVDILFPTPVKLQNYSADTAFTSDAIALAETKMGVDGKLTAGFTPNPIKMKVKFPASSESIDIFDAWVQASVSRKSIFYASATIEIPGTGHTYTLTKGVLSNIKMMPDAKKTLDDQEFELTWESVTKAAK